MFDVVLLVIGRLGPAEVAAWGLSNSALFGYYSKDSKVQLLYFYFANET